LKILLADDSMTAQNMAKKILSEAGYDVVTVSNGAAALKKIAETAPDLVILDIYMPGYSGFEVCERVKRASAHTPVLLSVGKLEPYREEDALAVRANGVIVKPFEATELLATVERVMPGGGAPEEAPAAPMEIPAVPVSAYENYAAPASDFDRGWEQPATPAKPAEARPESAVSITDAAFATAFPALASETPLGREIYQEASNQPGTPPGAPPLQPLETPGRPAAADFGARPQAAAAPFAIDLLGPEPQAQPAATAAGPAYRAEPAPPPAAAPLPAPAAAAKSAAPGADLLREQPQGHRLPIDFEEHPADRGPELAAKPVFDLDSGTPVFMPTQAMPATMPATATRPAAAGAPLSEADFLAAGLPPLASAAPAQSPAEAVRLDAPAAFTSKWRIEVRSPSPQPPTAATPASTDNDFSIDLLPELEPKETPSSNQAARTAGAAPPIDSPLSQTAPVASVAVSMAAPAAAEKPAAGLAVSAPMMLEATAAMSFPELSDGQPPAVGAPPPAPAAISPEAERHEAARNERPAIDITLVTTAVQRAMDRYRPLIIAEIVRELGKQRGS
jgi:CheY-like chemotaxis protein